MRLQTSIETINGHLCTVIRKPFDVEWVRKQLEMGIPVVCYLNKYAKQAFTIDSLVLTYCNFNGFGGIAGDKKTFFFDEGDKYTGLSFIESTATILPALPRLPKPEDELLLHRYMAEGLIPVLLYDGGNSKRPILFGTDEFIRALEEQGNGWAEERKYVDEITHALDLEDNRHEIAIKNN